jgi:N-acetylglutamate synthase-like GNAT family acetyltransferase
MRLLALHDDQVTAGMRERITCFLSGAFPGCACASEVKQPVARLVLCEDEEATIIGHSALYRYDVRISDLPMEIGMIGEVAIKPEYRGQGLLNTLFLRAHDYFRTIPVEYSMVFPCHPDVFTDFGYRFVDNKLFVPVENDTWRPFTFRGSMYCRIGKQPWPSGDIYFSDEPCQT